MAETPATLLASVEAAILSITGGGAQSRTLADRRWEGLDLGQLFTVRDKLKAEISASDTTTTLAEFEAPS